MVACSKLLGVTALEWLGERVGEEEKEPGLDLDKGLVRVSSEDRSPKFRGVCAGVGVDM